MTSASRPGEPASSAEPESDAPEEHRGQEGEDAVTRSEEQLQIRTVRVPTTRVRVRKQIITESQTVTVQVSHEELVVEHESITDLRGVADQGTPNQTRDIEIILHTQRPVITMETVAVERIRVSTTTITEDQTITEPIRKEQIELHQDQPEPAA